MYTQLFTFVNVVSTKFSDFKMYLFSINFSKSDPHQVPNEIIQNLIFC